MDELSRKVLAQLERRCSKCECCSSDIFDRAVSLLVKSYGDAADMDAVRKQAGEILGSLQTDGYVDDLRYASAFAREKSSITGWGPVKIRFALRRKNIGGDVIENALSEVDAGKSDEKLHRLLAAKWKTLSAPDGGMLPDAKYKLIKFALSRGYEYEEVKDAVEAVIRNGQS